MIEKKASQEIIGRGELTEHDVTLINEIRLAEKAVAAIYQRLKRLPRADKRQVAIARTEFEHGFMRLTKAITRQQDPFDGEEDSR